MTIVTFAVPLSTAHFSPPNNRMSSHHANPFSHSHRSNGTRIPSNSSSGSSWHDPNRWANDPADMDQLFTSDMRDRQARGKDPYADDLSDAVRGMGMHHRAMSMTPGAGAGPPSSSRYIYIT